MKVTFYIVSWCAVAFLILSGLYHYVPVEMQYSMAEFFNIYGDELVMDFVLYAFFGLSILLSSVILSCVFIFLKKNRCGNSSLF